MTYSCDRFGIGDAYCHLLMATDTYVLLRDHPDIFFANANGVGSKVGWSAPLYHLIPDTIWFLNIRAAANVHDVEYKFPETFQTMAEAIAWKNAADHRFLCNMEIIVRMQGSCKLVERARLHRAMVYFLLVQKYGMASFMDKKTIIDYQPV